MKFIENADFVALDFETATNKMDSACSVGIAVVKDLRISETFYSLIKPPDNQYLDANSKIHGITSADTVSSDPAFMVLRVLLPYFGAGIPVVAHNAAFDMSVLHQSLGHYADGIDFKYIDTMEMVRPYSLPKRGLADCAAYFGIDMGCHHNALDDAVTCALIAISCINGSRFGRFSDYCLYVPEVKIKQYACLDPMTTFSRGNTHRRTFETVRPSDICPTCPEIDPTGPLYGKAIVFTGELSISRTEAAQLAVNAGAILKSGVSRKTDYLVVGAQDIALVGADGLSTKEEKAYDLNNQGKANIRIIGEREYFDLLCQSKGSEHHE